MSNALARSLTLYKNAYTGHPKEIWTLFVVTLINRMGTMVLLFLTVYLTTILHFSLREAGVLAGAFGLGSLGGAWAGGKLADRIDPNRIIYGSLFLGGLMLVGLQFATSFTALYGMIFFTALFGEAYRPALTVSIANYVPPSRTGRTMAFIRLAINLGMSASPAIGGFVAASLGYHYLFWIDGLTCVAAAIYFWAVSRNWEKHLSSHPDPNDSVEKPAVAPPHKNALYLKFLLASFLLGFCFIQWFQSVPVFIKTEWGFDERYIGIMMAAGCLLITFIEMPLVDFIEKSNKIKAATLAGLVLLGISFLPFLFPKALWLCFLAMFFMTIGEILFLPFNTALAMNLSPKAKRGEYMAWYWMTWSMTNVTGPTVGLLFAGTFGFSVFWLALCGLIAVSWIMHYVLM